MAVNPELCFQESTNAEHSAVFNKIPHLKIYMQFITNHGVSVLFLLTRQKVMVWRLEWCWSGDGCVMRLTFMRETGVHCVCDGCNLQFCRIVKYL